jgi:hypothetical protein
MILRFLPFCAAGILLAGCTAGSGFAPSTNSRQVNPVHGYLYHDGNHPDGLSLSTPQADSNATHGTWLWPPAESDRPN